MSNIFTKEFIFKGKHAKYVLDLTKDFEEGKKSKLFNTNIDVFLVAAIVGVLYKRAADVDTSSKLNTSIFAETLSTRKNDLEFIYKMIILTDRENKISEEQRIEMAFRHIYDDQKREQLDARFVSVVLGGVEYLHENIVQGSNDLDVAIRKLFEFLKRFNEEFGSSFEEMKLDNKIGS